MRFRLHGKATITMSHWNQFDALMVPGDAAEWHGFPGRLRFSESPNCQYDYKVCQSGLRLRVAIFVVAISRAPWGTMSPARHEFIDVDEDPPMTNPTTEVFMAWFDTVVVPRVESLPSGTMRMVGVLRILRLAKILKVRARELEFCKGVCVCQCVACTSTRLSCHVFNTWVRWILDTFV